MLPVSLLVFSALMPFLFIGLSVVKQKIVFMLLYAMTFGKTYLTILFPIAFTFNELPDSLHTYYWLLASYIFALNALLLFLLCADLPFTKAAKRFLGPKSHISWLAVGAAALFFLVLIANSRGVFLIDPRAGYQYHRSGVGIFWVFYITSVSVLFYFQCVRRPITALKIVVFAYLFFLTGSKQLILVLLIASLAVYKLQRGRIGIYKSLAIGGSGILLFLVLFDQFGADNSLLIRLIEYFDFLRNASRVFDDYQNGELDFQNGRIFASSYWSYVPRAIYPDKPYAYGATAVLEMYYPGLAATGHTPSFGPLTTEFVDFGFLAPLVLVATDWLTLIKLIGLSNVAKGHIVTNSYFRNGTVIFVLAPGFGFHLPIVLSIVIAFFIIPRLTKRRSIA